MRISKHSKTIKALSLRPRAFISFLVFGNPDEIFALVYEKLLQTLRAKVFVFVQTGIA